MERSEIGASMIADLSGLFRPFLAPGEALIWSGRPHAGLLLKPRDAFLIPFGVFFMLAGISGAVSFMFAQASPGEPAPPSWVGLVFSLPFLAIGSYFAFCRLLWDRMIRKSSSYALTDQRAIVVQRRRNSTVKAIWLRDIADVALTVGKDRIGTITFNESTNPVSVMFYGGMWGFQANTAFELIENADDVYRLVSEARAKLRI